jgi:hypothetical protein
MWSAEALSQLLEQWLTNHSQKNKKTDSEISIYFVIALFLQ